MKFKQFLSESSRDIDSSMDSEDKALKRYVLEPSVSNRSEVESHFHELLSKYKNKEQLTLYRGMNFDTEEDYNDFLHQIKTNKGFNIKDGDISSWSRKRTIAKQFAVTRPSYMESMSTANMFAIKKSEDENEHVVGYRGIILTTTIKPGIGIDVNKSDFSSEDEIILPKGTYKVETEEVLKNSDLIKAKGLTAVLEKYTDSKNNSDRKSSIIMKAIKDNADSLTDKDKKLLASHLLKDVTTYVDVPEDIRNEILVSFPNYGFVDSYRSIFLKDDLDNYEKKLKISVTNGLKKIKNYLDKNGYAVINWPKRDVKELAKRTGNEQLLRDILSYTGKKWKEATSDEEITKINNIDNRDEFDKQLDDYTKKLLDILKSASSSSGR